MAIFLGAGFGVAAPTVSRVVVEAGGHTADVNALALSPDGRVLVSVGNDKVGRVWDVERGHQVQTLRGPVGPDRTGRLYAVAYDAATRVAAVGGEDIVRKRIDSGERVVNVRTSAIRLYNVDTGRMVGVLSGHDGSVVNLAFSKDGRLLASCDNSDRGGHVRVWDVAARKRVQDFAVNAGPVYGLAFSPTGDALAACGDDGKLTVWSASDWKGRPLLKSKSRLHSLAWSPDGRQIAVGALDDHQVLLIDPSTKEPARSAQLPDYMTGLAYSSDSKSLYVGSGVTPSVADTTVHVLDAKTAQETGSFRRHSDTVLAVVSAAGRVVSGDKGGRIFAWSNPKADAIDLSGEGRAVYRVGWSPTGRYAFWSQGQGDDERVTRFDLVNNEVHPGEGWSGTLGAVLDQNGRSLRIEDDGRLVRVGGPSPITIKVDAEDPEERAHCGTFMPDGRIVLGTEFGLAVYDAQGRKQADLVGHDGTIYSVAPRGSWLLTGSSDQTARLWNLDRAPQRVGDFKRAIPPELSLFSTQRADWMVWTPEGYYTSSPEGDGFVGWQVDHGDDREAELMAAVQFRHRFRIPEIVCRVFLSGGSKAAIASVVKGRSTQDVAELAPTVPSVARVEIVGSRVEENATDEGIPLDAAGPLSKRQVVDANKAQLRIAFDGLGEQALASGELWVYCDRSLKKYPLGGLASAKGGQSLEATVPIDLPAGDHLVTATAHFADTLAKGVTVRAGHDGKSIASGELYLLTIGVTQYQHLNPLRFAASDASEIAGLYKDGNGRGAFTATHVVSLLETQVTIKAIDDALDAIKAKLKHNDSVIVTFSGHGVVFPRAPAHATRYYFALADSEDGVESTSGLLWTDAIERLASMDCRMVLVVQDACHSGGVGNGDETLPLPAQADATRDGKNPRNEAETRATDPEHGIFVLSGCRADQSSYEFPQLQHGVLSYAVLGVLTGHLGGVTGDAIDLWSLRKDVIKIVPRIIDEMKLDIEQTPRFLYPVSMSGEGLLESFCRLQRLSVKASTAP